jgi:hypothetical protein
VRLFLHVLFLFSYLNHGVSYATPLEVTLNLIGLVAAVGAGAAQVSFSFHRSWRLLFNPFF